MTHANGRLTPRHAAARNAGSLAAAAAAIALATLAYAGWLEITNPTIVALSFLLIVLIVAAVSTRWVAVATSVMAFMSFNFFFLQPVHTLTIAEPEDWVALFALLAVGIVASHLSAEARRKAREASDADVMRRSAELKATLLGSLRHDLKTPLSAATVAAANLDATWLDDEQRREQVALVRSELDRLNRLFQNILDLAHIEIDAIAPEPEWIQPAEIVEAAARQVEDALGGHPLVVEPGADGAFVLVDPRLTSAALAHVLENAAQYSPAGSEIAVDVRVGSDNLVIAVRDRGPGVAPEDAIRLFERSYRGASSSRHPIGTGMGLAITRGLLAAEGGRVWADPRPGGGSTFTIAVPARSRPAHAMEEPPP